MNNSLTYRIGFSVRNWLKYQFFEKKLNTVLGFMIFMVLAIVTSYTTAVIDYKIGIVIVMFFVALLVLIAFFKFPYFGFYFLIAYSSIIPAIDRILNLPVLTVILVEALSYLMLLVIFFNYDLRKKVDPRFWSNPIMIGLYILFAYYVIELFNPDMTGTLGWFSFFRKQLSYVMFCYMCYSLFHTKKATVFFIYFMIGFSTALALYACKQQFLGYADFEMRSIIQTGGYHLLLQGGLLRKFSVFTDPANSGILFAAVAMLSIVLFIRDNNIKHKFWFLVAAVINILGYSFSGTRTATLMIVSGIGFYSIATIYEKRTLLFLLFSIVTFVTLMVMPYQNVVTNRIRSTFEGTKDQSAALRDYDRHQIQPYYQERPLGGGIFTCGFEGVKYNPNHYLVLFQPDGGYMKDVAEQGAVGLALLLLFYFISMRQGIRTFYRSRDPEIQNYYIALLVMLFTLMVAQYSQMAIHQYPVVYYFYGSLMLFLKLADYDKEPNSENTQI